MQSMSSRTYKWIMVYQDHLTKFCVLRPLKSNRAAEVAFQLADIFLLLGAPVILQSDSGSEFTAQIITEHVPCGLNYPWFTVNQDTHRVRALLNEQMVT